MKLFFRNSRNGTLLKGTFVNWNHPENKTYDAMNVTNMGGNPVTEEVLEYVSNDKRCAVVSVVLMGAGSLRKWSVVAILLSKFKTTLASDQATVLREIRVPENALESEPEDGCKKKFEEILKVAKKNAKSHYSRSCKTVTSPSLAQ
ncbi:hypothetical protein V5799_018616 [Amblyomma americanum]|uniref:Uncharacterized protein n=1 Tax=Amblyomma americanum TaxID=6943 RepID=A0AAQ4EYZ2_AMBAM